MKNSRIVCLIRTVKEIDSSSIFIQFQMDDSF